mgnify:CR=1 FL=1
MEIIDRIVMLLNEKGVEQKALAEYLGVHPQVITEWKGGRKKSYMRYIDKIAAFFEVSTDYILGNDPIKNRSTLSNAELNVELETLINDILNLPPSQIEKVRDYVDFLMSQRKFSDNK